MERQRPRLSLVVAVDQNGGIGFQGQLLARVRGDLRHFRTLTEGKTVILGSKTLATFPGGKPLKNRRHIILSRRADFAVEGAEVAHSAEEALSLLRDGEEAFVIGGASVYSLLLPYVETAVVSRFEASFPADAFFPDLGRDPAWELVSVGEKQVSEAGDEPAGMVWRILTYRRLR